MARIPEGELERLKREVSVEQLARGRGVELKRHGSDLIGLCPMHEDHEPSLVITPSKNLWHCLGACQAGGSVIDWVMRSEGVSFRNAVERLRELSAISPQRSASINTFGGNGQQINSIGHESPFDVKASDRELMVQVINYYHETLKQSPEALEYLERRGLNNSEMIERFKLGYANRTLGYRLPDKNRAAGAEVRTRLQNLGILRESGHEHFNGSLIVPVFDESGTVTEIYGRKIHDNLRTGTPKHLYLPGPHRGVWNIEALGSSKEIILCEALIDALTFWSAGFHNVTSSYGIEGFTADHLAAFKRNGIEKVLIAYDRDEAGAIAARILSEKLTREGITCCRIQFPRGMDANEYALKVKPADKALGLLIRTALEQKAEGGGQSAEKKSSIVGHQSSDREAVAAFGLIPTTTEEIAEERNEEIFPLAAMPSSEIDTSKDTRAIKDAAAVELASAERCLETTAQRETTPPPPGLTRRSDVCKSEEPSSVSADEVNIELEDRRYRVRGLSKNLSYEHMKVTIYAMKGDALHVDTVNLCSAYQRTNFSKQAATELGEKEDVIKRDLGKLLLALEQKQEEQIKRAMAPKQATVVMSEKETQAALELLKDPNLLKRILEDFERCGVVGEETNKLMGYLAAVSRKMEEPLAVIIQSSSSAGKTSLMEAVLAFVPPEQRVKYSAMTGQSLFYMSEADLKHKILAIVEEEGVQNAAYALKLLQSEGELTIASTGKDPQTGRLVTHEYKVEGPVMIFITTTAVEIDEELFNRCIVLTVNEDREQTRAIHRIQREMRTIEGLWARDDRKQILALHQNAQRLLRPLPVANPHAHKLTFIDSRTRTRRDHVKYLTLIETIALLHQCQREIKTIARNGTIKQYIEVTKDDIRTANRLANEALGHSLDELPPQTRGFLKLLHQMVREQCGKLKIEQSEYRFRQRDARERTGWSDFQVKMHLRKLVDMEYVIAHRAPSGNGFVYELAYHGEGEDGGRFLMGLIDVEDIGNEGE